MNADQTNVLQSVPVEQIFLKWNLNQTRSLLWKTPWSEFDSYSSVWRFIALTPPSVIVPTGSAERRRGLHRVYSSSEQSPEPGPSHSRSHRQRLHEEEGESECGGGPHQTWNQTERSERTRPLSVGAVVTWFLWSRPPGCSQVKETLIVLSFMSLCSGERSSHLLQWNNNTSHFWGGQDATQTHQQDFEHDHQPRGETKNHRRHLCQSQYRFLFFLICIVFLFWFMSSVNFSVFRLLLNCCKCWTALFLRWPTKWSERWTLIQTRSFWPREPWGLTSSRAPLIWPVAKQRSSKHTTMTPSWSANFEMRYWPANLLQLDSFFIYTDRFLTGLRCIVTSLMLTKTVKLRPESVCVNAASLIPHTLFCRRIQTCVLM